MAALLREEGAAALKDAKANHDKLEAVYNPYVDFDGVRTLAGAGGGAASQLAGLNQIRMRAPAVYRRGLALCEQMCYNAGSENGARQPRRERDH